MSDNNSISLKTSGNRATQISRAFWLVITAPLAWGLMKLACFGIDLFPMIPRWLADHYGFPMSFWPGLGLALGVGLGLLGCWKFSPLRITTTRILVQISALLLFVTLVLATSYTQLNERPQFEQWLSGFLQIDPLVAVSTALSTHEVHRGLIWSLVVIVPTLLLGRVFCGWVCPFGAIHHFAGWLFNSRSEKDRISANQYRGSYTIKYYILIAMLVCAPFGLVQIGLLDPLCLLHRSLTTAVLPVLDLPTTAIFGDYDKYAGGWFIGFLFVFFVAMNVVHPRFFCRMLCPLGALLGLLSRFSLWRVHRNPQACTDCHVCSRACEGACEPDRKIRLSECFVCFNCFEDCRPDGFQFRFLPPTSNTIENADLQRRRLLFAAASGAMFFGFTKISSAGSQNLSSAIIRPPGTLPEPDFLARCITCNQCAKICPTNVIQPALLESGIEGLWTPTMNYRIGFCELNCTACGRVCPTGAILPLSIDEKLGHGEFQQQGPVRLGRAYVDRGRCVAWEKGKPCMVCEEVCPVSPKSVYGEAILYPISNGSKKILESDSDSIVLCESISAVGDNQIPCKFKPSQFKGDQVVEYFVEILRSHGEQRVIVRVLDNDETRLEVDGPIDPIPKAGDEVTIFREVRAPRVAWNVCIGCGLCENACPGGGERRAISVSADGATRSLPTARADSVKPSRIK